MHIVCALVLRPRLVLVRYTPLEPSAVAGKACLEEGGKKFRAARDVLVAKQGSGRALLPMLGIWMQNDAPWSSPASSTMQPRSRNKQQLLLRTLCVYMFRILEPAHAAAMGRCQARGRRARSQAVERLMEPLGLCSRCHLQLYAGTLWMSACVTTHDHVLKVTELFQQCSDLGINWDRLKLQVKLLRQA